MRYSIFLLLLVAACGDDGHNTPADAPHIDGDTASPFCTQPTGPGTMHAGGSLDADETWTAAGSPHMLANTLTIQHGHTLTIEECAVVNIAKGQSIYVGSASASDGTGTLIAHGTAGAGGELFRRPVRFTTPMAFMNWGSIVVDATGHLDLESVNIDQGGAASATAGGGGAIIARGDDNRLVPLRNVRAVNVLVSSSETYGFNLRASAGFTADSADIQVATSSGSGIVSGGEDSHYPIYIESPSIQTLPTSTILQANNKDEILAHNPFVLSVDERFPGVPYPYQLRSSFTMAPSTVSTINLTIDPGVTIKMGGPLATAPFIKLGYGQTAADNHAVRLNAAGTAAKPIKITSGAASPAAGDWVGIDWQGGPGAGNVMSYVTMEYGGANAGINGFGCGPGDNSALLMITNWRPDNAFVTNSTFKSSSAGGIVSGWANDTAGPNLLTGNTFTNIANACNVSQPKSANGMCPGNDSNPDCY